MADSILKVRITPEMVQDLVAFHGMNVITELKKIAKRWLANWDLVGTFTNSNFQTH
jgi:hypothetical protein